MFLLIVSRLLKDGGDLLVAFFPGDRSKVGVLVTGLGFSGECLHEVLFRFCSLDLGH